MNEDELNLFFTNQGRQLGIPISFQDLSKKITENLKTKLSFTPSLLGLSTAYKWVDKNGVTNVQTPEVTVTPQNKGPRLTYNEYQLKKKLEEKLKSRDTAGKIGAAALTAGLAPAVLGTTSYAWPILNKGLTSFGRFMTPSSHTAIFGSGSYNTALGGTNASVAGATADNLLFSLGATSALKRFSDDSSVSNGINMGLAMVPGIGIASGSGLSSSKLLYKLLQGKLALTELTGLVGQKDAKWVFDNWSSLKIGKGNINKLNAILEKAANGLKGKRGANEAIDAATRAELALTKQGKLKLLLEEYLPRINTSKDETGIDWSDVTNPTMSPMDMDFKMSPVGFDQNTPFIERYYKNVMKVIAPDGILTKLLKSGELRRNSRRLWEGLVNGKYQNVEPTDYIKMRMSELPGKVKVSLPSTGRIPGATYYPIHGTRTKDIKYLTKPSDSPGKDGYWTIILDENNNTPLINFYKGKGYSIPFFRMGEYELPVMKSNGIGSSNSWNGSGESLKDLLNLTPGKIQRPRGVSDPSAPGRVNEYNFGRNVPNPKSMWNTLDFEPGAGPLAYNNTKLDNNNNFA